MATDDRAPDRNPPGYPADWEVDVLLTDGAPIQLRPIRPGDRGLLAAFHGRLSAETVHARYQAAHPILSDGELRHLVEVDYHRRMAFVALDRGALVGVVRYDMYEQEDPEQVEVAFVVADAHQRRGVGTLLFEHLVAYARLQGVDRLWAAVAQGNTAMVRVFEESGFDCEIRQRSGSLEIEVATAPTPRFLARRDERERVATAASVARILRPRSVAVVGAGRDPGGVGHAIVRHLVTGELAGAVYPVNPSAHPVCGVPAYPSLGAVPGPVDLAVVAVPAASVLTVAGEAAKAGVGSLVVVSSGFAELGPQGSVVEGELLALARARGMRVVGPNGLGVANTDPAVRLDATFGPSAPPSGPVALLSQSGAVGIALLEEASRSGLGVSSFVSAGNKLDVSSNDLLCFWETDPRTQVVALYLESFGNPRKFARIARRVSHRKPIVVLKAGRTEAGARGAASHTASAATSSVAVATLLASCGAIQVESLEDLLDTVKVLAGTSLPAGRRVALVGNSGGPLILAADACASSGLLVEPLERDEQTALAAALPPSSGCANPVDVTASATATDLEAALTRVLADPRVDAVVAVVTPVGALAATAARQAIERAATGKAGKPLLACLLGAPGSGEPDRPSRAGDRDQPEPSVPFLPSPERAAAALRRAVAYAEWRARPEPVPAPPLVDARRVAAALSGPRRQRPSGGWLDPGEATSLLQASEVPVVPSRVAGSLCEALEHAAALGYPVVLKAVSPGLLHKSDAGGVVLDLGSPEELTRSYLALEARFGAGLEGVMVQPMASSGVETIVGVTVDPSFGPLLMFGIGGTTTDLIGDHAFAVPPVDEKAARALITSIRCAPLLTGFRGSTPVDLDALVRILRRVGDLALACPEVVEVDLNPVLATPDGAVVLDTRVRLAAPSRCPEPTMRLLRPRRRAASPSAWKRAG